MPVAVAVVTALLLRSLARKRDYPPFFLALGLFALSYAGLGISMWPYIVPRASRSGRPPPESSQVFMLVGVGMMLPLILAYTGWAYWVFRGKVGRERLSLTPTEPNPRPLAQRLSGSRRCGSAASGP